MTDAIDVTTLSERELAALLRGQDNAPLFLAYWLQYRQSDDPLPIGEYPFAQAIKRRWRFDWVFISARLAVEVDGIAWQAGGGRHNTDKDREKMNYAAALGWRVMHFSAKQLNVDPLGCVELVIQALSYK